MAVNKNNQNEDAFIWIAGTIAVFIAFIVWLINTNPFAVKNFLINWGKILSFPFQNFPFFEDIYYSLETVPTDVISIIPYEQIYIVLYKASIPYLILSIIILLIISRVIWKKTGIKEMFRNKFNMQSLLEHNVKMFPWLAPIANRDKSILDEPYDNGPWQTPRLPIQWAAENDLIVDEKGVPVPKNWLIDKDTGLYNEKSPLIENQDSEEFSDYHLDFEKAKIKILAQYREELPIPDSLENFQKLPDYYRGIIAALMAFSNGGESSKKEALKLFNTMSLSFVEGEDWDKKNKIMRDYKIDIGNSEEIFKKYLESNIYQHLLKKHGSYINSFVNALTDAARDKGVLESSKYIWVRPTDNLLFNCLNQSSSTAWVEGLGPWTHYQLEKTLKKASFDKNFSLEIATKHLDWYLSDTGWYYKCKFTNKSALTQIEKEKERERKSAENSQRTNRRTRR